MKNINFDKNENQKCKINPKLSKFIKLLKYIRITLNKFKYCSNELNDSRTIASASIKTTSTTEQTPMNIAELTVFVLCNEGIQKQLTVRQPPARAQNSHFNWEFFDNLKRDCSSGEFNENVTTVNPATSLNTQKQQEQQQEQKKQQHKRTATEHQNIFISMSTDKGENNKGTAPTSATTATTILPAFSLQSAAAAAKNVVPCCKIQFDVDNLQQQINHKINSKKLSQQKYSKREIKKEGANFPQQKHHQQKQQRQDNRQLKEEENNAKPALLFSWSERKENAMRADKMEEEDMQNDDDVTVDPQVEKAMQEDLLQQQSEISIRTIQLDTSGVNEDADDLKHINEILDINGDTDDDLSLFDISYNNISSNYNNYNNININNNFNINNSISNITSLYDSSTYLPFLNSSSSSSSPSSSILQSPSSSYQALHNIQLVQSSSSAPSASNDLFEIAVNESFTNYNFTIINSNITVAQTVIETTTTASTTATVSVISQAATVTASAAAAATTTQLTALSNSDGHLLADQFSWKNLCFLTIFFTFIVITIIGNTLVILAVVTTRRLRTVTNCFVMSLAVADLLVGIFVMPPAVAVHILDSWPLSWVLCDIYISLDVLLCTASILSLCAISVDRYLAVTQPLTYSRKRRSKRLALIMILIVWLLALAITCPPILGWYEQGRRDLHYCRYNQNEGYVIFSAMGSFFIPMTVMIYVYARISCVVASRHDNMTDIINNKKSKKTLVLDTEPDIDQISSEVDDKSSGLTKKQCAARTLSNQTISRDLNDVMLTSDADNPGRHLNSKNGSSYELIPTSRTPSFKRQSILCNSAKHYHQTTTISSATDNRNCASASSDHHHLHHHPPQHHHQQHWANYGRHSVRMHNTTLVIGGGSESYITRNTRVHHQKSLSNRITSLNKENKTTQTLSIVVGGFIVCWLPFFLNYIIAPFLSTEQKNTSLDEFLTWLGWFNSAVNPFIYAFYSVDFRAAFWRLTLKRFYKNSSKNQFPSNTMSIRR